MSLFITQLNFIKESYCAILAQTINSDIVAAVVVLLP